MKRTVYISMGISVENPLISITGLGTGQSTNLQLLDKKDKVEKIKIRLPTGCDVKMANEDGDTTITLTPSSE